MARKAKQRFLEWKEVAARHADEVRALTRTRAHEGLDRMLTILLSPWKLFKIFCFSVGLLVLLLSVGLGFSVYNFFNSLPDLDRMTFEDFQEAADARVLAKLENKKKKFRWVPMKKINRDLLFAIVVSEDATFFEHGGFNFEAMVDSLAENIKERRAAYGASTISQQVVKNVFLSNEKTIYRKLKEALITYQLERRFSKNEILEVYLNIAEIGPDIFGVNAASYKMFGKSPAKINAAEGAFMALMLPSPRRRYYTIYENQRLSRTKRRHIDRVLRDMYYTEFITDKEYTRYRRWKYFGKGRLPARQR